jgi:precorrin-6B methylase 2
MAETRVGIVQYLPQDTPVGDSIRWYGEYLQLQLDVLLSMIRPGATVVEVGAGVGIHSLALARAIGNEGHLMLYESRLLHQRILRQNLAANEAKNVTIMRRSLGDPASPSNGNPIAIEALNDLRLERLDIIKINGSVVAADVIAGATEAMWRLRPLLFALELDKDALASVAAAARDLGYRCWKMETPLFNSGNFNRREEDIFGGRKIVSVLGIPEETELTVVPQMCTEIS